MGRQSARLGATGASAIVDREMMLCDQEKYLKRILLHIYEIAKSEAATEIEKGATYLRTQFLRRPHQTFLIDGARGSGKTTLLLTVQQFLKYLGRPHKWTVDQKAHEQISLESFAAEISAELKAEHPDMPSLTGLLRSCHSVANGVERQTAYFLPVLFPSDLDSSQSIMEGLLALVEQTLDAEIARLQKSSRGDVRERIQQGKSLRDRIHERVAAGWFLSRNTGTDALLRDSADYQDFLSKRGEANVLGFARVEIWREFVNDYLDFFRSELLVVFFDDTDVATPISRDILHTVRIFLDHPRVVTVIAGNLHSIRQSLVLYEMKVLGGPIGALTQEAEATARDWRRYVRQEIEESLEKVLPRRFRFYIAAAQESSLRSGVNLPALRTQRPGSDFVRMFGCSFDKLCGTMLDFWRNDFLEVRHRAHFRWLEDRQEILREEEANTLENYVSWWLFRHLYAEPLRPKTVRHMAALRAFTSLPQGRGAGQTIDNMRSEFKKRLPVILYESPENFEIIHRLGDGDRRLLHWLHRQTIESSWKGDRYFAINDRRIYENTYSYQFLLFRLDLGIAMPILGNPEEILPEGMLPKPDGPNLTHCGAFFSRSRRQRLYGVAKDIAHTVIPANCIYMFDADSLPDAAWMAFGGESKGWEQRLLYDWPKTFFFDLGELRSHRRASTTAPMPSAVAEKNGQAPSNAGEPGPVVGDVAAEVVPHSEPGTVRAGEEDHAGTDKPSASISAELNGDGDRKTSAATDSNVSGLQGLEADLHDFDEQLVSSYFIHNVIPLASAAVGSYVASHEDFSDRSKSIDEVAKSTLLYAELTVSSDFFGDSLLAIERMKRRYDYLESVATGASNLSVAPFAYTTLHEWTRRVLDPALGEPKTEHVASADLSSRLGNVLLESLRTVLAGNSDPNTPVPPKAPAPLEEAESDATISAAQLLLYRWIVNDVRRGWHAARIFLNQVSGTVKRFSSREPLEEERQEAVDGAGEMTRKDRFFRADRYTIGTRSSLLRWLTRSPTLADFIGQVPQKTLQELPVKLNGDGFWEADFLRVREDVISDLVLAINSQSRERLPPSDRLEITEPSQLCAILQVRTSAMSADLRKQFFFDPFDHLTNETPTPAEERQVETSRTRCRLSRSLLLFLYGFAPTLPALIHLEVAAVLKVSDRSQEKNEQVDKVLEGWTLYICQFLAFVQAYSRILEFTKIRLDIMELWRLAYGSHATEELNAIGIAGKFEARSFGAWMTLTPDMAFGSLGVRGLAGLPNFDFSEKRFPALRAALKKKRDLWAGTNRNAGRIEWQSVIDDVFDNLVEAANFIEVTRRAIELARQPPRQ